MKLPLFALFAAFALAACNVPEAEPAAADAPAVTDAERHSAEREALTGSRGRTALPADYKNPGFCATCDVEPPAADTEADAEKSATTP